MHKPKLLLIGDHFISSELMQSNLGDLCKDFEVHQASTNFPVEPYHDVAEVREASGSEEQMIKELQGVTLCVAHHAPLTRRVLEYAPICAFSLCVAAPCERQR